MKLELFLLFTVLNVIVGTIKSIATIKGTKFVAAIVNAAAYAINTISIVYTADESLGLFEKITIVAITNFVGVYIVKLIEEKRSKDRLWKIECTVTASLTEELEAELTKHNIAHKRVEGVDNGFGKCTIFSIYSKTKEQSSKVKLLLKNYRVKYFIVESQVF